jgi:hypothetical protein
MPFLTALSMLEKARHCCASPSPVLQTSFVTFIVAVCLLIITQVSTSMYARSRDFVQHIMHGFACLPCVRSGRPKTVFIFAKETVFDFL